MNRSKLLIIDDDRDILMVLRANLELQGFNAFISESWQDGRALLEQLNPDLLILDLTLPDMDGLSICKAIREDMKSQIPIVARDKLSDNIIGLESGADDYMVKPFETLELIARIKACLRSGEPKKKEEIINAGLLTLDVKRRVLKMQQRVS